MNILITGGAGFIGSHLCEALLNLRHNILVYDNFNNYYSPELKRENIRRNQMLAKKIGTSFIVVEADIRDKDALNECFKKYKFDIVVHLAACVGVRPSIDNAQLYVDVNVQGTTCILECMKKYGVKKLLFASSSAVYGNNKKIPFCETDNSDSPISPYGATKKSGEILCYTYHQLYNINVACLRFFTVYGSYLRPDLAIYKFIENIYYNKTIHLYGDGFTKRAYTYIDDVINGILLALKWINTDILKFDVFNIGNYYTIELNEVVATIEQQLGKSSNITHMAIPLGDVNITYADISKATKKLGYTPNTSFKLGIEKTISWFLNSKLNKNNMEI